MTLRRGIPPPRIDRMTYRQFVAALVAAGLEGNSSSAALVLSSSPKSLAERAVKVADALIVELALGEGS